MVLGTASYWEVLGLQVSDNVMFTASVTLIVSALTFIGTNAYINHREKKRTKRQLADIRTHFLWVIGYLNDIIPVVLKRFGSIIDSLATHKNVGLPLHPTLPIEPELTDGINGSDLFRILISDKVGDEQFKQNHYSAFYHAIFGLREFHRVQGSLYTRVEDVFFSQLRTMNSELDAIQNIHDALVKDKSTLNPQLRLLFDEFDLLIKSIDVETVKFDELDIRFFTPIRLIADKFQSEDQAVKLVEAARVGAATAVDIIASIDGYSNVLREYTEILEVVLKGREDFEALLALPDRDSFVGRSWRLIGRLNR